MGLFDSIADDHVPIKRKRVREKDIPYMTLEWNQAIRNKRKYAILFSKNRTPENFELKKKYRNIATHERRIAIKAYWNRKSEESKTNSLDFFKIFKPFINKKMIDSKTIILRNEDGEIVRDQTVVAESLGTYFSTAAVNMGGNHVTSLKEEDFEDHKSIKVMQDTYNGVSFSFKSLKTHDVQCACEDINPKKSCSWDKGLPPKLLKKVASGVAPSLAAIYNNCIESGQWPTV